MRSSVARALLVAALTAFLAPAPSVAQEESKPPPTALKSGETRQRGLQGSYCWDRLCADYIARWPRAKDAEAGARARIRFKFSEKPEGVEIAIWDEIDEDGFPQGDPETPDFRLRRRERDGETFAWDAIFRLPDREGHAYASVFGRWPEHGDSSWTFHLRLMQ